MQWSTDIRQGKRGTVGSSLHRENLGELPNGPRGCHQEEERAAPIGANEDPQMPLLES